MGLKAESQGVSDRQALAARGANAQLLQVPAGGRTVSAVVPDYKPHSGKPLAWWAFFCSFFLLLEATAARGLAASPLQSTRQPKLVEAAAADGHLHARN